MAALVLIFKTLIKLPLKMVTLNIFPYSKQVLFIFFSLEITMFMISNLSL